MNQELKDIIISIYGKVTDIEKSTVLSKDLSFTSMHFVQLIVELEAYFEFEFSDDELDLIKIDSVDNLNKIVNRHIVDKD